MPTITIKEELTELKRELSVRYHVYPNLINAGRLEKKDSERRIERLKSTINRLQKIEREQNGTQEEIFKQQ